MTSLPTAGRIHLQLVNNNDLHNPQVVLTPPAYCKLRRFNWVNSPVNQQLSREFDVVVNEQGLQTGLSSLPECGSRYRLSIKLENALGYKFMCRRPIMLTNRGQVNNALPAEQNTFILIRHSNTQSPTKDFRITSLYQFPNVVGN